MAILSVLGLGLWLALYQSHRLLGGVTVLNRFYRDFLLLDTALRREMSLVRLPYWEGESPLKEAGSAGSGGGVGASGEALQLPFLDGNPGRSLVVEFEDGYVSLDRVESGVDESSETESSPRRYGPFSSFTWEAVFAVDGKSEGVLYTVSSKEDQETLEVLIPLSSHPLYIAEE
jgi:hypothetical protein